MSPAEHPHKEAVHNSQLAGQPVLSFKWSSLSGLLRVSSQVMKSYKPATTCDRLMLSLIANLYPCNVHVRGCQTWRRMSVYHRPTSQVTPWLGRHMNQANHWDPYSTVPQADVWVAGKCCQYEDILLPLENVVVRLQSGFSCHLFCPFVSSSSKLKSLLQQCYIKLTRNYKLIYNMISQKKVIYIVLFYNHLRQKASMRPTYFNSRLIGRLLGIRCI